MNNTDIVFMILSSLLVWIMPAGLALFYGGLTPHRSMINTMMMVLLPLGFGIVCWYLFGYSLTFSGDHALIGNLKHFALTDVSFTTSTKGLRIPDAVFAMFQGMFPLITLGIIAGAVIDRINLKFFIFFCIGWLVLVYYPLAHMVWGNGLIEHLGALDFAGGDVVHISSGITALILALKIGKRQNAEAPTVHCAPAVAIGMALLWFGWFGFNAGSALGINEGALYALQNTFLASATSFTIWNILDYYTTKHISLFGSLTGALVGLVLITPSAGLVTTNSALLISILGTPIHFFAIPALKAHFHYDDALDAFGAHGLGGILGGIFTGLFASEHLAGVQNILQGNFQLLGSQLSGIVITILWATIGTLLLTKLLNSFMPLTTDLKPDMTRDTIEHGESSFEV